MYKIMKIVPLKNVNILRVLEVYIMLKVVPLRIKMKKKICLLNLLRMTRGYNNENNSYMIKLYFNPMLLLKCI